MHLALLWSRGKRKDSFLALELQGSYVGGRHNLRTSVDLFHIKEYHGQSIGP